jgi:hypothetical protein
MTRRFAIAFSLLAVHGSALAQGGDVKGAEVAYDEAEKLLERGQLAQACLRYADSYRMDPQLGALLHVGDCNERIDKLATAWRAFDEGYRLALQKRDERALVARERADALLRRLSYLRVNLPPDAGDQAKVLIDGKPIEQAALARDIPVDRGTHSIVVTSDGQEKWRTEAPVKGVPGVLYFDVPSWRAPPPAPGGSDSGRGWFGLDPSARRVLGWSAVGLGVAGLGLSTYFFVLQGNKADEADAIYQKYHSCTADCDDVVTNAELEELEDAQKSARTAGVVSAIAGSVFLAGGAILLFVPPPGADRGAGVRPPRLGLGFGTVTLRGEF